MLEGFVGDVMHSSEMALQAATIMDEVDRNAKAITNMIGELNSLPIKPDYWLSGRH